MEALSKLDEFLFNPQVRTCSVAVPGTSKSNNLENQGTNEDRPSDDPGPEVELSSPHSGAETDPHMVTGVTREIRQHPYMTMETQEEIPYCSTSTSSGKQKKARSTSQPQFRSENTPATLEADQILLALQQLATNSNSANFNNNISRIVVKELSLLATIFLQCCQNRSVHVLKNFLLTTNSFWKFLLSDYQENFDGV